MTAVPANASAVLGDETPIRGEPDEPIAVSGFLLVTAMIASGYAYSVQAAAQEMYALRSKGVTALQQKCAERLIPGATMLGDSASAAKTGFDSYGYSMETIHRRARKLRNSVEDALAEIRGRAGEIAEILDAIGAHRSYAWNERIPEQMPTPSEMETDTAEVQRQVQRLELQYEQAWRRAARAWHDALEVTETAPRKWGDLLQERREAERSLVGALHETELGRLLAVGGTAEISTKQVLAFAISGELHGKKYSDPGVRDRRIDPLLAQNLPPERLAERWWKGAYTDEEITALPVITLAKLADLDGIPARVQNIASTQLLHYAIIEPANAYELMGFRGSSTSLEEFRSQTLSLHGAWQEADKATEKIRGGHIVQLLGLGNHEGALTAAISHGDLDTASHVGVNISGMFSNVGDIGGDAKAARAILQEALDEDPSQTYAVVTWIGYKSPHLANVNYLARAGAGGERLAGFLMGFQVSRETHAQPIENLAVFAHSYGSTTASEALKLLDPKYAIDDFVTYGSAGLARDTTLSQLRTGQMFSTQAEGDTVAEKGRLGNHPLNPIEMPGIIEFSAEGGEGYLRVNSHAMFTEPGRGRFGKPPDKVGYTTPRTRTLNDMGGILATGGLVR